VPTTLAGWLPAPAGLAMAAFVPGLPGAAVAIGAGTALITPPGFAALAASAPAGRLGQTMGAPRSAGNSATPAAGCSSA